MGKACETNKTNNIRNLDQGFWTSSYVHSQRLAYIGFNLCTHAYDMRAWDLFKNPNLETRNKKQSTNKKNPNSNYLACSEHNKTIY